MKQQHKFTFNLLLLFVSVSGFESAEAMGSSGDFHDLLTLRELALSPPTPDRAKALKLPSHLKTDLGRPYVLRETQGSFALVEINGHAYRLELSEHVDQSRKPGAAAIQYPLNFLDQLQRSPGFSAAKAGGFPQLVYAMALGNKSVTEVRELFAQIQKKSTGTSLSPHQQTELTAAAAIGSKPAEETLALYQQFRAAKTSSNAASTLVLAAAVGDRSAEDILKLDQEIAETLPSLSAASDRAILTAAAALGNQPIYEVVRAYRDLHLLGTEYAPTTCVLLTLAATWGEKSVARVADLYRELRKAKPGLSSAAEYASLTVTAAVDDMILLRRSAEQASLGPVANTNSRSAP